MISAGIHGRASLSKLQVFGFSLIVVWLLTFFLAVVDDPKLNDFSPTVLGFLGISAAGTLASRVTAVGRQRISLDSWAWLMSKGWIKESLERKPRPAELGDLMKSGSEFDVAKFQMLAVSVVVAVAKAWKEKPPTRSNATLTAAIKAAPEEDNQYQVSVKEAAEMVMERIGAPQLPKDLEPTIPRIAAAQSPTD